MMTQIDIEVGPFRFVAQLEETMAPRTCAMFWNLLPFKERLIHVRWSGEGGWIPMGALETGLPWENPTSYPAAGQFIFYPGGFSETEILLAYGSVRFASNVGQLAGNHFLTITEGAEQLSDLGQLILWEGAQPIHFKLAATS